MSSPNEFARMPLPAALRIIHQHRDDRMLVITSMGSAREWPQISNHPLDFHYLPSTMSGAVSLGLGLALAQPQREVLVFSGDGSLLMSLGCLVTVTASGAENLTIVLLDNGAYEITGGQRTAGSIAGVNFAGMAQAAGFPNVAQFAALTDLCSRWPQMLAARGPRFAWLQVAPVRSHFAVTAPGPMPERIVRLRQALTASD
jgi:sulfopyruvate decarboxylase subunit beta